MGKGGISGNPLCKSNLFFKGKRLKKLFNTSVCVSQFCFQQDDFLSVNTESEVSRFNNSGMNRTDRDFINSFPFNLLKFIRCMGFCRPFLPVEVLSKRK